MDSFFDPFLSSFDIFTFVDLLFFSCDPFVNDRSSLCSSFHKLLSLFLYKRRRGAARGAGRMGRMGREARE